MNDLQSIKTVIRTKDFATSVHFYKELLKFEVVEEYDDNNGSKGCILSLADNRSAMIEISEILPHHDYYDPIFDETFSSYKAGMQFKTANVQKWKEELSGKWTTRGPILRPWGASYLYLEDPDGLPIIIYQEKE
jgi:catechol 2,3-dioxygenase-like lactoylglutathione lyase family enzyme